MDDDRACLTYELSQSLWLMLSLKMTSCYCNCFKNFSNSVQKYKNIIKHLIKEKINVASGKRTTPNKNYFSFHKPLIYFSGYICQLATNKIPRISFNTIILSSKQKKKTDQATKYVVYLPKSHLSITEDKREYLVIIWDNFCYYCINTYHIYPAVRRGFSF